MANYKKSLIFVKEYLDQNENIHASVYGAYETKMLGADTVRNGIFIATENRLVFFSKKLFGYDLETFSYKNISSLEISKGLMGHSITVFASGNTAKMKWINKGNVDQFNEYVNSSLEIKNQTVTSSKPHSVDIPTQILKLSNLKDQGILTEDEFLIKKKELLSKM
jgi:hypothetical protein|tara:strand:- start:201 stop:695 length:495 start_codon:yes stop_codon:yes gene_type:complete